MINSFIVDGHCDSLIDFVDNVRTLKDPSGGGQWDIQSARHTGVSLQFLAAYIQTKYKPDRSSQRGLQLIEGAHRFIANYSDQIFLVQGKTCLLYTSDAADEEDSVDLGGRRIIKKKKKKNNEKT